MAILIENQNGRVKVIEPTFEIRGKRIDVYFDESVLNLLENDNRADDLENLNLIINFERKLWDISEEIPVGTPGTIASVVYHLMGSLLVEDGATEATCTK